MNDKDVLPLFTWFLDLRLHAIPRSDLSELRQETQPVVDDGARYYLQDVLVNNGDIIEVYVQDTDSWITGRFVWSGDALEDPSFYAGPEPQILDEIDLVRWPLADESHIH